jgi:hypothetical protein
MSATRRDVLKTMLATPVVALLPSSIGVKSSLSPASIYQEPIHLIGMGTFWDKEKTHMYWPHYEVHIDDAKAVFRVKNPFDETVWEEVTYEDPSVIAAFRTVSQMLHVEWETPA